jgi:hypothetical protein
LRWASYWRATLRTRPISTPSRSIAAPAARPRTVWSKVIRIGTATPSAGASAERRSANSVKTAFSGACAVRGASGDVSNARPPARTEASVWVLTLSPLAFNVRSMPLAFQKRVLSVTSFWYGASMKIFSDSSSRSASSV